MKDLPLHPFLASLEANGIRLILRNYERITLALQTGDPWTIIRLSDMLLALWVKDVEWSEEPPISFSRRFRLLDSIQGRLFPEIQPPHENHL